MKKIGTTGVKTLKLFHILFAMVWMSGALAMVLISQLAISSTGDELYMKYTTLLIVDNWMIIVSAISTIVIGIIYGAFTNWGFFKHNWIIVKWIITIGQALYGTFAYHPWLIRNLELAQEFNTAAFDNAELISNNLYMQISGYCQLSLLIFAVAISVFKPWRNKKKSKLQVN